MIGPHCLPPPRNPETTYFLTRSTHERHVLLPSGARPLSPSTCWTRIARTRRRRHHPGRGSVWTLQPRRRDTRYSSAHEAQAPPLSRFNSHIHGLCDSVGESSSPFRYVLFSSESSEQGPFILSRQRRIRAIGYTLNQTQPQHVVQYEPRLARQWPHDANRTIPAV
jgi:hypothetical protein